MTAIHVSQIARSLGDANIPARQGRHGNPTSYPPGASEEKLVEILRRKPYTATPSEAIAILMAWPTRSQADGGVVGISWPAKGLWNWLYAEYSKRGRKAVRYTVNQLGALLGVHSRSVQRYLSELEATGWLHRDFGNGWAPQTLLPQIPDLVAEHCLHNIPDRRRPAPGPGSRAGQSPRWQRQINRIREKATKGASTKPPTPNPTSAEEREKISTSSTRATEMSGRSGDKFDGQKNSDRPSFGITKIPRRQTKGRAMERITRTRILADAIACENTIKILPLGPQRRSPRKEELAPRQLSAAQHDRLVVKINHLDSQSWSPERVFQEAYSAITMGTLRRLTVEHAINTFCKLWREGEWKCGRKPNRRCQYH